MYCTACGSYSSDAGGHVCAEPEATVHSTTTTATTTVGTPTVGPPPAGWHPDPADPALVRYWDGAAWTEHTAWASASRSTPAAAATAAGEHGRFLGALPRTAGRGGRVDILVYERSLVFARVPGIDPALLGFVLGLPVSGVVGYIAGDYLGANGDGPRIHELTQLVPEQIAAKHKRNAIVPVSSITGGRVVNFGRGNGRMKLRTAQGKKWRRRWTRPHLQNVDAHLLLSPVIGTQVEVKRSPAWRPFVPLAALVGLVVLLALAATFLGRSTVEQEEAAMRDVTPSCKAVIDLNNRAGGGEQTSPDELVATVHNVVEPMRKAAGRADAFAPAMDAANRLDAFFGAWDRASDLPEPVLTDLGVVLNTCIASTS